MKLHTKILLILILILCLFVGSLVFIEYNEKKKMAVLSQNEIENYITLFERILELESHSLENFVFDYSSRKEIVNMTEKGSSERIDYQIKQGTKAFYVDAVWIFDNDFNLLYTTLDNENTIYNSLSLPENGEWKLFMWRSFYRHFFNVSQKGLLEIRTAPVQLPGERASGGNPRGFMFAGRLWTEEYVRHISTLSKSKITLLPPSKTTITEPQYDTASETINFLKIFHDPNKEPVMVADVVYEAPLIKELTRISTVQFFIIIAFLLSIIAFLILSTLIWVGLPLRKLSSALVREDISVVEPLKTQSTEFGRLAEIVINFFRQKEDLLESYAKIKKNEQQLKAYNQQISAQEEELKASNQELEANYQEILSREQELKGLNRQLSAQENQLRASNQQLTAANAQLIESQERYRQLLETMNDGLAIVDKEGCFIHVNESFCKMLGYSSDELIGVNALEFISDESRKTIQSLTENPQPATSGYSKNHEVTWTRKDGQELHTLFSHPKTISDNEGNPTSSFSVITDITERINAEKQLLEYKNFLENVIENSRDGIFITDYNGNIILCNKTILNLSGLGREEIIGEHSSFIIADNEKKNVYNHIKDLIEKGYTTFETVIKNRDGRKIETEISANLIVKEDNIATTSSVCIVRDITERKNTEKQIFEAEKLRSLGQLSGGVAHDLNNVLAAVLGRVQIIKKSLDMPEGKKRNKLLKNIEIIERASNDAAETVRRIQQFAKPGDDKAFFRVLDINTLIEDSIQFTKTRWKEDANYRGIKYEIARKLNPVADIEGNPSELREVFTNLIINAIDAMPEGGKLTLESYMQKDKVVVVVSDMGKGISKELHNKIFEPFFTTKGPGASGLGTSVSYGIIERHGGSINIESELNKGTSFIIKLSRTDRKREEEKPVDISSNRVSCRILVIEDEEAVRDLLCDILTDAGHKVETAQDGFEGIEKFEQSSFDMIFTDFGMPGISGIEVAKKIRDKDIDIPIVMITGWGLKMEQDKVDAALVNSIINKPFQIEEILDTVAKLGSD